MKTKLRQYHEGDRFVFLDGGKDYWVLCDGEWQYWKTPDFHFSTENFEAMVKPLESGSSDTNTPSRNQMKFIAYASGPLLRRVRRLWL